VLLCFGALVSAEPADGDIVFLVDVSQSMLGTDRFIAQGARLATYELEPNDRVAVMTFSSSAKLHSGLTSDAGKIDEAFRKAIRTTVSGTGGRRVYDAVFAAFDQFPMAGSPNAKRIVAIITNDVDLGSRHTSGEVIEAAAARGVAIWVFLIADPFSDPSRVQYPRIPYPDVKFAADQFRPMTMKTGGSVSIRDLNGYILRQAIAACKGGGK
jgi:uncharacterized protein (DUF58 family)